MSRSKHEAGTPGGAYGHRRRADKGQIVFDDLWLEHKRETTEKGQMMSRPIKEQLAQADWELDNCLADLRLASWWTISPEDVSEYRARLQTGMVALKESSNVWSGGGGSLCNRLAHLYGLDLESLRTALENARTARWVANDLEANRSTLYGLGIRVTKKGAKPIDSLVREGYATLAIDTLVALVRVISGERRGKTQWFVDWLALLVTKTQTEAIRELIQNQASSKIAVKSDDLLKIGEQPRMVAEFLRDGEE